MSAIQEAAAVAGLYEADYYAWTQDQAAKLRRRDFAGLDLDNLVEEVESLGRSEEGEVESRLAQLLMHLLKWQYQSLLRSRSWTLTIAEQRRRLRLRLRRTPSLRPKLAEFLEEAYSDARLMAERETGMSIDVFPVDCPYAIEQVMDDQWLPAV